MSGQKTRLFVAVEVPAPVRDRIDAAAETLRLAQPDARWVTPRGFHLTLAFIGWADEEALLAAQEACAAAAVASPPFELALTGTAGMFGNGVLWAGLEDSPALDELAAAVRSGLAERELTVEARPFHAHVTLARASRGSRLRRDLAAAYDGPRTSWRVDELLLMRSRLQRGGSRYTTEAAWRLGA